MDDLDRHLTDPDFFCTGDPHAVLGRLRAEDPVHWTQDAPTCGFWSVTRYADVAAIAADPRTFSSQAAGIVLPSSPQMEQITPKAMGCGESMIMTDPPRHIALRKAFNRIFLPRAVAAQEASGAPAGSRSLPASAARGRGGCVLYGTLVSGTQCVDFSSGTLPFRSKR